MTKHICSICGRDDFYNKKSLSNHRRWHNPTEKLIKSVTRENHPNWKGGISKINHIIRTSDKYKEWRLSVFNRDNFTCQGCEQVGGYLEVHHIKGFAKYPEFRFDINNGITLCKKCHIKVDKYRGGNRD